MHLMHPNYIVAPTNPYKTHLDDGARAPATPQPNSSVKVGTLMILVTSFVTIVEK